MVIRKLFLSSLVLVLGTTFTSKEALSEELYYNFKIDQARNAFCQLLCTCAPQNDQYATGQTQITINEKRQKIIYTLRSKIESRTEDGSLHRSLQASTGARRFFISSVIGGLITETYSRSSSTDGTRLKSSIEWTKGIGVIKQERIDEFGTRHIFDFFRSNEHTGSVVDPFIHEDEPIQVIRKPPFNVALSINSESQYDSLCHIIKPRNRKLKKRYQWRYFTMLDSSAPSPYVYELIFLKHSIKIIWWVMPESEYQSKREHGQLIPPLITPDNPRHNSLHRRTRRRVSFSDQLHTDSS